MLYIWQQRSNKVQTLFIYESIFKPWTMNFAVRKFLCKYLDFRQFTVDSSENNTLQKTTKID